MYKKAILPSIYYVPSSVHVLHPKYALKPLTFSKYDLAGTSHTICPIVNLLIYLSIVMVKDVGSDNALFIESLHLYEVGVEPSVIEFTSAKDLLGNFTNLFTDCVAYSYSIDRQLWNSRVLFYDNVDDPFGENTNGGTGVDQ